MTEALLHLCKKKKKEKAVNTFHQQTRPSHQNNKNKNKFIKGLKKYRERKILERKNKSTEINKYNKEIIV